MKKLFLMLAFVLAVGITNMYAPPTGPPGDVGTGDPIGGPTGVPIDGGLGFLAAAGIAYAGKKLFGKKDEDKTMEKE